VSGSFNFKVTKGGKFYYVSTIRKYRYENSSKTGDFVLKKYPKTIEEIYESSQHKEVLDKLRFLVKHTVPQAIESVRRGGIIYRLQEKDFLRIHTYETHVDLGFADGTRIASLLLKRRGKGLSWRHLEFKTSQEVENPEVKRLLEASAEICK
jgi:hypothetical protein